MSYPDAHRRRSHPRPAYQSEDRKTPRGVRRPVDNSDATDQTKVSAYLGPTPYLAHTLPRLHTQVTILENRVSDLPCRWPGEEQREDPWSTLPTRRPWDRRRASVRTDPGRQRKPTRCSRTWSALAATDVRVRQPTMTVDRRSAWYLAQWGNEAAVSVREVCPTPTRNTVYANQPSRITASWWNPLLAERRDFNSN